MDLKKNRHIKRINKTKKRKKTPYSTQKRAVTNRKRAPSFERTRELFADEVTMVQEQALGQMVNLTIKLFNNNSNIAHSIE